MGKSGIVFHNQASVVLPESLKPHVIEVDTSTGRLDFEDGYENPLYNRLIAAESRLLNVRDELIVAFGSMPPLLYRIFGYDVIAERDIHREEVSSLSVEIDHLKKYIERNPRTSENLRITCDNLLRLCATAIREKTGICIG